MTKRKEKPNNENLGTAHLPLTLVLASLEVVARQQGMTAPFTILTIGRNGEEFVTRITDSGDGSFKGEYVLGRTNDLIGEPFTVIMSGADGATLIIRVWAYAGEVIIAFIHPQQLGYPGR